MVLSVIIFFAVTFSVLYSTQKQEIFTKPVFHLMVHFIEYFVMYANDKLCSHLEGFM